MASRGERGWPPAPADYDVLVNATPVKEDVIVAPHGSMQVVDLAYLSDGRDTALVAAAKEAGCEIVIDGLDILLFQGVASFECWTGLPAPVVAMRAALHGV
jgi:shikimate dehydrogenase